MQFIMELFNLIEIEPVTSLDRCLLLIHLQLLVHIIFFF